MNLITPIFETTVLAVGDSVGEMLVEEGVIITYRHDAPPELKPFSYMVNHQKLNDEMRVGDAIFLDEIEYEITAIGEIANQNLAKLGHLVLRFDGKHKAMLPGSVHVKPFNPPNLMIGSKIDIKRITLENNK